MRDHLASKFRLSCAEVARFEHLVKFVLVMSGMLGNEGENFEVAPILHFGSGRLVRSQRQLHNLVDRDAREPFNGAVAFLRGVDDDGLRVHANIILR